MRRFVATGFGLWLLTAALAGCGSPCEDLAAAACERAGTDSDHCKKMRAQAESPSVDEQRSCRRALRLVDTLSKNK